MRWDSQFGVGDLTTDRRPKRARSASDKELRFGQDAHGRIVPIELVTEIGLKCGLRCADPTCGRRLIAYLQGKKKRPHLAHAPGADCRYGRETALHKYAKQLIEQRRTVKLPAVTYADRTLKPEQHLSFDTVVLENRFHDVIPDLLATVQGVPLLIEIYVTHACDDRKRERLAVQGSDTVEIDLSALYRTASLSDLDEAILESAPRSWVYHHAISSEKARLSDFQRVADEATARALIDALREQARRQLPRRIEPSADEVELRTCQLHTLIGLDIAGAGITGLPAGRWQSALLKLALDEFEKGIVAAMTPRFDARLRTLQGLFPGWADVSAGVAERARDLWPAFVTPSELAERYAAALVERGFLLPDRRINGAAAREALIHRASAQQKAKAEREAAQVAARERTRLAEIERAERARQQHAQRERQKLLHRLGDLLDQVPEEERAGFRIESWWDTPLADGRTPNELDPASLSLRLRNVEALFHDGAEPIDDLLNLPFHVIQAQRVEQHNARRQAEIQRQLAERVALLDCWAARPDQMAGWIDRPQRDLDGSTPRQIAVNGGHLFYRLRAAEEPPQRRYEEQLAREREGQALSERFLQGLLNAAEALLGPAHADNWIGGHHSQLWEETPAMACRDRKSYLRCLDLLETDARKPVPAQFRQI